ncbi:MAG TPA: tetratricopeptide repeat protein [Longimicrobium sp.]|nr:tetratricopeptide repeat protein [Longimicrobium sp.]
MASSSAARARQSKTALNSDDMVAMRTAEAVAWARRNVRTIVVATALLGAAVLGLIIWKVSEANKATRAAGAFLSLQQDPSISTPAGAAKIEAFIRANGGTMEADEARMMLAEVRLRGNQARQAIPPAREVADGGGPLAVQAAMLLGDAHFQAGERAAAVAAYERAAKMARLEMHKFEALNQAAQVHENAGAFGEAARLYERMLQQAEKGSPRATVIEMRLTEARARAGAR